MSRNTESSFTEKYLPNSKRIIVDILCSLPDKIYFVFCINHIFRQFNTLETQECFLLGDFNINLLFNGEEILAMKL